MAIRPEDIRSHLDLLADKLEHDIHTKMTAHWNSRDPEPQITVNVWPEPIDAEKKDRYSTTFDFLPQEYHDILALLKKRYEDAGWTVTADLGEEAIHRRFIPTLTIAHPLKKPGVV
jgi:hypothetical protein